MIVFYQPQVKKITPVVTIPKQESGCSAACSSNCLKPKSKCCNKYKKKGINCKRCPLTFELKAVS